MIIADMASFSLATNGKIALFLYILFHDAQIV